MERALVLGGNGFIGSHLTRALLQSGWVVHSMDLAHDHSSEFAENANFSSSKFDLLREPDKVANKLAEFDVVIPLIAIATPKTYVTDPLSVFELDFEANLSVVRAAAAAGVFLLWPSTSEVYGMAGAEPFDPYSSNLVTGPVNKSRWIYASCKQLMDRVIHAYGEHHSLNYTIFRPFNWFGPGLDSIQTPGEGGSRVVTSFIASLMTNSDMVLVDGGSQRRAFTHVDDGIDALIRILQNRAGVANRRIYNIGTPTNDASILELAELLLQVSEDIPQLRGASARVSLKAVDSTSFYGEGYQDVQNRLPDISHTMIELGWRPRIDLRTGLLRTVQWYANEVLERSEQYDG